MVASLLFRAWYVEVDLMKMWSSSDFLRLVVIKSSAAFTLKTKIAGCNSFSGTSLLHKKHV